MKPSILWYEQVQLLHFFLIRQMLQHQPLWWFFPEFESLIWNICYTGTSKIECSIPVVVLRVLGRMELPEMCLLCPCSFHPELSWLSLLSGCCWLMLSLPSMKIPRCFTAQQLPSQALPRPYFFQGFLFLGRDILHLPLGNFIVFVLDNPFSLSRAPWMAVCSQPCQLFTPF